jgi:hypothetical protein
MRKLRSASNGRGSTGGLWLAGAALALACLMPVTEASAASKVCRKLEAQLVSLSNGGGRTTGQSRKYDGAIARQRQQLSIARGRASDLGCGFAVFGRNLRQCAGLNATISRMQDNLATLERTRGSMGGGSSGKSRSRILASLDANGCRGGTEVAQRRPMEDVGGSKKRTGLIASLFGLRSGGAEEPQQDRREIASLAPEPRIAKEEPNVRRVKRATDKPSEATAAAAPVGDFATMCVRTCDGYFFPMSPSSSAQDFDRDQKNCESACPGAEMQVFYRSSKAAEDSDMMSVATGRPYTEMSTAYRYKDGPDARPATCGCNVAKNFSVIAGNPPAPAATIAVQDSTEPKPTETAAAPAEAPETVAVAPDPSSPSIITIVPAPSPAAPATPAEAQSAATAEPAAEPATPATEALTTATVPADRDLDADGRKVRVVGPVFLPDPAEAIDLRAPAQTQVQ